MLTPFGNRVVNDYFLRRLNKLNASRKLITVLCRPVNESFNILHGSLVWFFIVIVCNFEGTIHLRQKKKSIYPLCSLSIQIDSEFHCTVVPGDREDYGRLQTSSNYAETI